MLGHTSLCQREKDTLLVPCDRQKFIPESVLCIYPESSFFWHGGYDLAIAPSWVLYYIDVFVSEIRAEFSFWTRLWLWAAKLGRNLAPSTSTMWPGGCQTLNSQGPFSLQSLNVTKRGFLVPLWLLLHNLLVKAVYQNQRVKLDTSFANGKFIVRSCLCAEVWIWGFKAPPSPAYVGVSPKDVECLLHTKGKTLCRKEAHNTYNF